MSSPDAVIALTGFGGLDAPHSGTSVARTLRKGWAGNITIEALGQHSVMTGAWMPGVADGLHLIPAVAEGDDAIFEQLMAVHRRGRLDALLPCLNEEISTISRLSERLRAEGIRTLLPRPDRIRAVQKKQLPNFFLDHQIPAPRTVHVQDPAGIPLHADSLGFPLLIRGVYSGVRIVYSLQQAQLEAQRMAEGSGRGVLLQQLIAGDQFNVALIADRNGGAAALVTMRKLAVNENGLAVCGTVVHDPQIHRMALTILKKLDWRGALELDFVRPVGSRDVYLRDINCHLPPWVMLSHWADCNLPVLLLQEMLKDRRGCNGSRTRHARPGPILLQGITEAVVPLGDLINLQRRRCVPGPARNGNGRINPDSGTGIRVAVTGTSSFDVVNPGIGVARALRLAPDVSAVYGLCYGNFDSGTYQPDLFDAVFNLPTWNDAGEILARLKSVHRTHPFDVIVPCIDDELPHFISIRDELAKLGVRTLLPSQSAFDQRSKLRLFDSSMKSDQGAFEIPESRIVSSEEQAAEAIEAVGLPAVVKGPISQCIVVNSAVEARTAWLKLHSWGFDKAIVQPLIEGPIFAVASVCDREHRALATLTVKKLARCDRGSTWSALHVRQPELEASFRELLQQIGWTGPVEGEFIRDEIRDRFYLIEINPRFTAWIFYSAALGSNHPALAVRAALGDPVSIADDSPDLVFMRSSSEIHVRPTVLAALTTKGFIKHA